MRASCSRRRSRASRSSAIPATTAQFEYIYKFVSDAPYAAATADGTLLDDGTLYVARFNDDGSGDWLALEFGPRTA